MKYLNSVMNKIIMSEELKSCPFCGGEEIDISRIYINPLSSGSLPDEVYVGCISCGIGYTEELEFDAIKAWNRRTPPQTELERRSQQEIQKIETLRREML